MATLDIPSPFFPHKTITLTANNRVATVKTSLESYGYLIVQIVLIYFHTDINANKTAGKTYQVGSHKTDISPQPPTAPAKYRYADQKNDFFHI